MEWKNLCHLFRGSAEWLLLQVQHDLKHADAIVSMFLPNINVLETRELEVSAFVSVVIQKRSQCQIGFSRTNRDKETMHEKI